MKFSIANTTELVGGVGANGGKYFTNAIERSERENCKGGSMSKKTMYCVIGDYGIEFASDNEKEAKKFIFDRVELDNNRKEF